ncbi:MAG TPA: polysaccharide ABC transporter ATP-binding protein [Terriglobales bacterium]|nr:polysaccharide ABC transporter ATP-binding protein [Terriglobales bacterium]
MSHGEPLIELRGVGKDYPRATNARQRMGALVSALLGRPLGSRFTALDRIDLTVRRGESLGIVGENGAGKSTLLKIISGVVKPTRGTAHVRGRIAALLELGSGFHPDYTGRENIMLSSALVGLSRREMLSRVGDIIAFADIGEHIDEPLRHYSSGMAVRLGFAVATALRPEVLVTDEVLAVGDESFQRKCTQWVESYLHGGGTLLLVSHSMFHIQTLCRHALWLDHGRTRMYGDSFEVSRDYLVWHHEKRAPREVETLPPDGNVPRIVATWLEREDGTRAEEFAMGETMVFRGVAFEPEDRPPTILIGVVRADGTPVYGTHSNDTEYRPNRLARNYFGFGVRFAALPLLPSKYAMRAHALDPEGLRLFDTVKAEFLVSGQSRDYGVSRLAHAWEPLDRVPEGLVP